MESVENTTPPHLTGTQAVVSLYKKHKKIYIRDVKGWWNNWRWTFLWIARILFCRAPSIEWNGHQAKGWQKRHKHDFFDITAQNHEQIAVHERASFRMP